ncbi:transposase [Candidatus Shapirobacteria bacterium]|nr:transposase [Candidatus Shapirobacteria bacterium]
MATNILGSLPELVKLLVSLTAGFSWRQREGSRGRPYVYQTKNIVNAFIVMVYFRLRSVRSLARFLVSHSYWAKACGFTEQIPSYRTLSRRLVVLDKPAVCFANQVIQILLRYHLISIRIISTDSSLCAALGKVAHKNHPEKKATDPDARWGWSESRDWVFGYKLHLTSTVLLPGKTLAPLAWITTSANLHDSKLFLPLMERATALARRARRRIKFSLGDKAYDINENYSFSLGNDFRLVTPVRRFKNRREIAQKEWAKRFVDSPQGKAIYGRRADNERLFAQLKDLFLIDPLPVKGQCKVASYLSVVCLAYLLGILYNHLNGRSLRAIKSLAT